MCYQCVLQELKEVRFQVYPQHMMILGNYDLSKWRSASMELFRRYVHENVRVEDLSLIPVGSWQYNQLYNQVYETRVHPIFRVLLNSKNDWDLHVLWFKLGDFYKHGPLLTYCWNKLLQTQKQSVTCLLNDIYDFRRLIDERDPSGILSSLYAALPPKLDSFAWFDMVYSEQSLGRLLRRLHRLAKNEDIESIEALAVTDSEDDAKTIDGESQAKIKTGQSVLNW